MKSLEHSKELKEKANECLQEISMEMVQVSQYMNTLRSRDLQMNPTYSKTLTCNILSNNRQIDNTMVVHLNYIDDDHTIDDRDLYYNINEHKTYKIDQLPTDHFSPSFSFIEIICTSILIFLILTQITNIWPMLI